MAITIINWHTKYRISYPPENGLKEEILTIHMLAVLLPVMIGLIAMYFNLISESIVVCAGGKIEGIQRCQRFSFRCELSMQWT